MKIQFLDKLIKPFGYYGYLFVGGFLMVVAGYFILDAVYFNNFISGVVALIIMFVVGYCWNKDTERVIDEKS